MDKRTHNPLMPGLRVRHDGWTAERVQRFLEVLGYSGCVRDAARVAGVSAASAYRMRARFAGFDAACRDALARAGRGLEAVAYKRAVEGRETIIIRNGEEYERRIAPSDAMLALLIKRGDLRNPLSTDSGAQDGRVLRQAQDERNELYVPVSEADRRAVAWQRRAGLPPPRKVATQEETDAVLLKRIAMVHKQRVRGVVAKGICPRCEQALTEEIKTRWLAEFGFDRAGNLMVPAPGEAKTETTAYL